MHEIISHLLSEQAADLRDATYASIEEFVTKHRAHAQSKSALFEWAVVGGYMADRLGYAFAAGYQAALRRLVPELGPSHSAVLCVTEEEGAHPGAIRATLTQQQDAWHLNGKKQWATMADQADQLLVAASTGRKGNRNLLRLAKVPRDKVGVALTPMARTAFAPEIPHFAITFDEVLVWDEALLPGDGYRRYIKPFRTIEDIHVFGAVVGYLMRVGLTSEWGGDCIAELGHVVSALHTLSRARASEPVTHLMLQGTIKAARRTIDGLQWKRAAPEVAERWKRDVPLLEIASKARERRAETAWRLLHAPGE